MQNYPVGPKSEVIHPEEECTNDIKQWQIQRGFEGFALIPLPTPIFKYPMKMK